MPVKKGLRDSPDLIHNSRMGHITVLPPRQCMLDRLVIFNQPGIPPPERLRAKLEISTNRPPLRGWVILGLTEGAFNGLGVTLHNFDKPSIFGRPYT